MNMQQNELDILQTILKPFCDKKNLFHDFNTYYNQFCLFTGNTSKTKKTLNIHVHIHY